MKLLVLLLLIVIPARPQTGKFQDGYAAVDHGVSVRIVHIQHSADSRCTADRNCPWVLIWKLTGHFKTVRMAEISLTVAGFNFPVKTVTVGWSKLDANNPVFTVPLATVSQIDLILFNGTKQVGTATFK